MPGARGSVEKKWPKFLPSCGLWGHRQAHGHILYIVSSVMRLDTGSGRGCSGGYSKWKEQQVQKSRSWGVGWGGGAWHTWWTKMRLMWIGVKLGGGARERQSDKILWLDDEDLINQSKGFELHREGKGEPVKCFKGKNSTVCLKF